MTHSTAIPGQFYPFTPSMAKKLREANLSAAEWRFWCYLTEHDPWGDRYKELDPLDIMRECGMSKATYYRAKAKLQELGLFDFQESKVSFRNLTGISKIKQVSQKSDSCLMVEDTSLKIETETLVLRQEPQEREKQTLEPAPSKDSKISQTLQTYSDLLKTLSEGMRESFEKFCKKKIQESPFPIASNNAWLNKHGAEYLQEFKEMYSEALVNPEVTTPKSEVLRPELLTLQIMYPQTWEKAAAYYGYILPNSPTVEINADTSKAEPPDTVDW
ncbi:hypothetical protein [Microcoleus sp. T3_A4]|uniref:hypothetical protein n=1 Tax=Microcoleus sp. T3_A4 TaxID=2818968 RepID=UPI002FD2B657